MVRRSQEVSVKAQGTSTVGMRGTRLTLAASVSDSVMARWGVGGARALAAVMLLTGGSKRAEHLLHRILMPPPGHKVRVYFEAHTHETRRDSMQTREEGVRSLTCGNLSFAFACVGAAAAHGGPGAARSAGRRMPLPTAPTAHASPAAIPCRHGTRLFGLAGDAAGPVPHARAPHLRAAPMHLPPGKGQCSSACSRSQK